MPAFMAETGLPLWTEITTTDMAKAQHFYKEVFGWDFVSPNETEDYFFAQAQGMPVAGLNQGGNSAGIITYFNTLNLEADVEKAQSLGAELLIEPTDYNRGRAAVLLDPAGALFGLMESRQEEDFVAAGEPGTPVWYELYATTPVSQFYKELLGWDCESPTGDYTVASRDGGAFAGILTTTNVPTSVWFTYFGVKSIDAAINAATLAGGQVMSGPEVNEFGIIASVTDPAGTVIILCEVAPWEEDAHEGDSVLD
ncbi:MAG: VOC family protein [Corynebacterium sp.]|nr:VOC family protein [Corynebacterium sp.]